MREKAFLLKRWPMPITAWVLAIVMIVSVVGYNVVYTQKSSSTQDYKAGSTDVTYGDDMYLSGDGRTPEFRSDARFKIIELVPYHGMAELGYTIGGEEPITLDNIESGDWDNSLSQFTNSTRLQNPLDQSEPLSYNTSTNSVINNNLFIKTTLRAGLDLSQSEVDDYINNNLVDVLVLEPDQLNANPDLIDEADMIYIDGDGNDRVISMYKKYSEEFQKSSSASSSYSTQFKSGCDISWEVALKLYEFACIQKSAFVMKGCAFDSENTATLNLNKLALLLVIDEYMVHDNNLMSSSALYEFFKGLDSSNDAKSYDRNNASQSLWTYKGLGYALSELLCKSSNADDLRNMKDKLSNGIVALKTEHVNSSFFGDIEHTTIITTDHTQGINGFISAKMGIGDGLSAKTDLCSTVDNDSRDVAIAIFNGQKPVFVVLDLEPDNEFSLKYKDVLSWMPENETVYKIQIMQMTMSEFVGDIDDINAEYDAIYLGNSKDKMKDGKYYYSSSDLSAASSDLKGYSLNAGSTDDSSFTYSGNDITDKKAKELKLFLAAGYPIIYENNLAGSSSGTKVAEFISNNSGNSGMYSVSSRAMSGTIDKGRINTGKVSVYLNLNNKVSEYTESKGTAVGSSGLQGLAFSTKYGDAGVSYKAYLYVDTNHDGIYNKWAQDDSGNWTLTTSNCGEKIWDQSFTSSGSTSNINVNSGTIPSDAMLGVVSWKLEVVKLSGGSETGIRSNITGNVYCGGNSKTIDVLQLGDSSADKGLNLSENSNFTNLISKSVVKDDYSINVTFQDIRSSFEDINIANYDVFIVGFINQDEKLADGDGLLNILTRAANKGKGIIFTQDALSYFNSSSSSKWGSTTNQRIRELLGLDAKRVCSNSTSTIASSDMAFTYSILNQFSSDKYFSGLSDSISSSDRVTMVNDAKVVRYPFIISKNNTKGFSTTSGIYQADVEALSDNILKESKVYYCLSDSGSGNYSVSPNDTRNNYYLLRNDTIFYSGVTIDSFSSSDYSNEQKLFVNTIVSAYGLERGIYAEVTNLPDSFSTSFSKSYVMYADFDVNVDESKLNGTKDVDFKVTQKGLSSPEINVKFYKCDNDGNIQDINNDGTADENDTIKVTNSGSKFIPNDSGSDTVTVNVDQSYTFEYPLVYLKGDGTGLNTNLLIKAEVKNLSGVTDEVLVKVLRRSMFDLD